MILMAMALVERDTSNNDISRELNNKLDYWAYFLVTVGKYERDKSPEIIERDSDLKEAFDVLENLELDSEEKKTYKKQLKEFEDIRGELEKDSLEKEINKFASSFNSSNPE
jgi:hypothetical protein